MAAPFPPPEILKGYNDCFEGGAKAIFDMAKSQQDHRIDLENKVITRELNQSGLGQIFAFIITISFLAVSGWLIYMGHEVSGAVLGSIDLVALVTVFILGKSSMKKANQEKESLKIKNMKPQG